MANKVNGNIDGIRKSLLDRLEALYDLPPQHGIISLEAAGEIADISSQINREISVYIHRNGTIKDVSIGVDDSAPLSAIQDRRSDMRLSRIRCIHTHPNGSSRFSGADISALKALKLDAMVALALTDSGKIYEISVAMLEPDESGDFNINTFEALSPLELESDKWLDEIKRNDSLFGASIYETEDNIERAFLIGIDSEVSLEELEALCESAGAQCVGMAFQKRAKPDSSTFIGSGRANMLAQEVQNTAATLIIADDELSNVQRLNLERICGARVIDRTTLILDIFAQRAKSREGKLQVELAQLAYSAGMLVGRYDALSRLAGGIGTRGPGETKLESDRRKIRTRISKLKKQLETLESQRELQRKSRTENELPVAALVGYTNVGKSLMLNRISGADAYEKDELFATLDTMSRRVELENGTEFILIDSVGFIRKLPTQLIEAFHSTLEEAVQADILLLVSDASDEQILEKREVVNDVLRQIGATTQPRIEVLNKADLLENNDEIKIPGAIKVSAKTGEGIDVLLQKISEEIGKAQRKYQVLVSYDNYSLLNELRLGGRIIAEEHTHEGTMVEFKIDSVQLERIKSRYPEINFEAV
ncbi:MAG: GTPase HflX [Christensenellaceae bacterium]|nr:GTPase HflX [Christensenellaceae bacterium]